MTTATVSRSLPARGWQAASRVLRPTGGWVILAGTFALAGGMTLLLVGRSRAARHHARTT